MPLAIEESHVELAATVDEFIDRYQVHQSAREQLDRATEALPDYWKTLGSTGFLAVHLADEFGGTDAGLHELAIVVERFGNAIAAGPLLATAVTSAILNEVGPSSLKAELLSALGTGELVGATALNGAFVRDADAVNGRAEIVTSAHLADVLVLGCDDDLIVVRADAGGVTVEADPSLDPTRRVATVRLDSVARPDVAEIPGARSTATAIQRLLLAADSAAGAMRAATSATEYAKTRKQFGELIGSFQAVKHHCVDMFIAQERATALVWDACRAHDDGQEQFALAAAAALAEATTAFVANAKLNIQVHGGIGFTWEHDAHILLRRSLTSASLETEDLLGTVVGRGARDGVRRNMSMSLDDADETVRQSIRDDAARLAALDSGDQRRELVSSGYLQPHWPSPWGRGAGALEQLIIDEELKKAGVRRPDLGVGTWIVETLIQHGTDDQVNEWARPSLLGDIVWCQLFSEPEAGSDAAAIRTKAQKVDGGWVLTGQKVWTSNAPNSNLGLATVRTDSDVPKHAGITTVVVDMTADGVDVRPLRDATGEVHFNEVFLDSVFVADTDVVGDVNGGWKVVRSALGNERVSIGSGSANPFSVDPVARYLGGDPGVDRVDASDIGRYLIGDCVIRALNHRRVLRAMTGATGGPEGNITKLLTAGHVQQATDLLVRMDPSAVVSGRGDGGTIAYAAISSRAYSIGGGTTEITKNQLGERILGLPRDVRTANR